MKKKYVFFNPAKLILSGSFLVSCCGAITAQTAVKNDSTMNASRAVTESTKIEKDVNNTSSEFFIIDDKPATKQEYLEYLRKQENEKKEAPKTSN